MNTNFNNDNFLNALCSIDSAFEVYREQLRSIADEYVLYIILKENKANDIVLDLFKNAGITNEDHRLEICKYLDERHVFPEVRKVHGRVALPLDDPLASTSLPEIDKLDVSVLVRVGDERDSSLSPYAVLQYEAASQRGDGYSTYKLAVYHEHLSIRTLEKDLNKAKALYSQAIEQGFPPAIVRLGLLYELGKGGCEQNLQTARHHYQQAIAEGSRSALIRLEILENTISEERFSSILSSLTAEELYSIGNECFNDAASSDTEGTLPIFYRNADFFYQLASERGNNLDALVKLGICYEFGRGGIQAKNKARAMEYYQRACYGGDGHALGWLRLGICNENGDKTIHLEKDLPRALECYENAIRCGSIVAINRKAFILSDLNAVNENEHLFKEAAMKGDLGSWFNAAFELDYGVSERAHTRNHSEAFRIFRYLATAGDLSDCAINHIGKLILRDSHRNDRPNDQQRAFQYVKYSNAYWGSAGYMYALGIGVERNDLLAFAIFQLESNRSFWDATWSYLVGSYYEEGIVVERNLEKAKEFYRKSIVDGGGNAEDNEEDRYIPYAARFALNRLEHPEINVSKVNCCLNCNEKLVLSTDLQGKTKDLISIPQLIFPVVFFLHLDLNWSCDSPCHVGRNIYSRLRDVPYVCPRSNEKRKRCRVMICQACYQE